MSKIADANYTLKATAEEGEAFQVLGVGDSESRLCGSFFSRRRYSRLALRPR